MPEMSPREIRDRLNGGGITPEAAAGLFQQLHDEPAEILAVVPREGGRFNALAIKTRYVFDHTRAQEHYEDRKDVEEGLKHMAGTIFYGATGIIDGTAEGMVYLASEVAETASFAVSRTINRVREGWKRGWKDK